IRETISRAMYFPDYGRGWIGRAAAKARALLRTRQFDVVVTSGPPHSAHYAGLLATLGSKVPHWVDMRDPWSVAHGRHLPDDPFFRVERAILSLLERLLFSRAAKVIVNTTQFASMLRSAHSDLDVTSFPNGIDLEGIPARDVRDVEQGSIAYLGALYAGRNLSSVFKAMSALKRKNPEAAARLRLTIAGPTEATHLAEMLEQIATAELSTLVEFRGAIARQEALMLLNRSHVALVLAQDQPMQVPAKLYECIGMGVATLVLAEETSAAATEAARIGAMTLDGADVDGMESLLCDLLESRIPVRIEPTGPISYEDLAAKMDRMLQQAVTA
ncbi:MAG: hypothetical protein DMD63_02780, partial [Gemmatimonadetes bacterium]